MTFINKEGYCIVFKWTFKLDRHCRVSSFVAHFHSSGSSSFSLSLATLLIHQIASISIQIPVQKPEHSWVHW